jgi:protein-disulfide isomerase
MYIAEGKVRIGYFHFAFLGAESTWAAEASECAGEQDLFWEYHDLLFEKQSGENQGAFNKDKLKEFATELDLDTEAFDTCLDSGKYTELVNTQTATAQQLGVRSTPTFAVNGQAVVGAQTFDYFQQVIEGELSSE